MRLYHSPNSPYVRKVLVAAHELGLVGDIELVPSSPSPAAPDSTLMTVNPLSRVPVLVLGDGRALQDSGVIVDYLASLRADRDFVPANGGARWDAMTMQSLADGATEAAQLVRYETVARPAELRWKEWEQGHDAKLSAAIDAFDRASPVLAWNVGGVSVACLLGYLDFRFPDLDWRARAPKAAAWFAEQAARPSMVATEHPR
jgi:glutathione S-transferase